MTQTNATETNAMLNDRKFGIEIECLLPRGETQSTLASAIAAAGVPCFNAGYTHARSTSWKIVSDASLRGTGTGMEIVSPPMQGEDALRQIVVVSRVLNEKGATVNRSCGLHVHVEANGMPIGAMRKLAAIYIENENIIDSFMPMSRRASNNTYCGSLSRANWGSLAQARNAAEIAQAIAHGNRFVKLNYSAFLRHGTVEFRHHSGTVDADKIIKWLMACLRLVATAIKEGNEPLRIVSQNDEARPRNRRLRIIYDAMQRPGGCTRQDIANLLGRRTMPPMNRILRNAGFNYRVTHAYGDRRTERYVLSETPVTPQATAPVTFDAFCQRIEMPEEEKNFWIERRLAVNTATQLAA